MTHLEAAAYHSRRGMHGPMMDILILDHVERTAPLMLETIREILYPDPDRLRGLSTESVYIDVTKDELPEGKFVTRAQLEAAWDHWMIPAGERGAAFNWRFKELAKALGLP